MIPRAGTHFKSYYNMHFEYCSGARNHALIIALKVCSGRNSPAPDIVAKHPRYIKNDHNMLVSFKKTQNGSRLVSGQTHTHPELSCPSYSKNDHTVLISFAKSSKRLSSKKTTNPKKIAKQHYKLNFRGPLKSLAHAISHWSHDLS